jgi:heat shock protein HslJ
VRRALLAAGLALACATGPAPGESPSSLERTRWTLASLGASGAPIVKTPNEAFLVFGAEPDRVQGAGGCNHLAGSYVRSGDELRFGPLASTRMACVTGGEVEAGLHAALERTARFRIHADALELFDASGALLATFTARRASRP